MLRDDLRNFWTAPRPPDVPGRLWRDWALLAAALVSVLLEVTLREDVVWRPVAAVLGVWLAVLPLWRRTRPLAMVALAFGAVIALQVATLVAAPREPVGLDSSLVVLVLVYALPRWGSGREIVVGVLVILAAFAISVVTDDIPAGEGIAALVFLLMPAVIGASVRFWATAQERQLERMRSDERERLARELHDTVAHHVSAMVIRAQAGRVLAGADPAAAVEARALVTALATRLVPEPRRARQRVSWRGRGFTADAKVYAHYVRRGKVRRTVSMGRPSGACPACMHSGNSPENDLRCSCSSFSEMPSPGHVDSRQAPAPSESIQRRKCASKSAL